MDFAEAYQFVIQMWPDEVDISEMEFHSSGGVTIPELIKAHDKIEDQCLSLGDEIIAMDWSIYQAFHTEAKKLYRQDIFILKKNSVDIKEIQKCYERNMEEIPKN